MPDVFDGGDADLSSDVDQVFSLLGDDDGAGATENSDGETRTDAAPDESQPSGEDEGQSEPTDETEVKETPAETSPIEPPASWSADEKEAFKALTPAAQAIVHRRETARDQELRQKQNETADLKKAVDQDRQRAVLHLTQLTETIQDQIGADFGDIKNEADYLKLKATDPQRAAALEARAASLAAVREQRARLTQASQQEFAQAERKILEEKLPEIRDPVKLKALNDGLGKMLTEVGYKPEELAQLHDHRALMVARDALLWRQHQANLRAAAAKKAAPPVQRTQRPGSGSDSVGAEKRAALLKRAANATNLREEVDALAALL